MVRPVDARWPVTLGYRQVMSSRPSYIHRGIDYGCPTGTPVVATKGGVVVYAGSGGGNGPACGLHVIVKTDEGIYVAYYHLSAELVNVGGRVVTGQQIGRSGATGNVTGPHLHYQEQTGGPGQYTTDRAPQFVTSVAAPEPTGPTVFDVCWWGMAAARYFGKPWLPRVPGIGIEIRGEASVYGFSELYDDSTATDILNQLNRDGAQFRRANRSATQLGGPVGLELMYDTAKWMLQRQPKAYPSGIQNRWAYVVHLIRRQTGQHVAFMVVHGPVFYDSLKARYGQWAASLAKQIDGPVVLLGDLNISGREKSPRKELYAAGFRDMRQQADIVHETGDEFPDRGWLSDIFTRPGEAPIVAGELDYTSSALSDHRRLEARVRIG